MYEVDLVGGPADGSTYAFAELPSYIYLPYMPKPSGLLPGPSEEFSVYRTPRLVYRHILNTLYWFMGIQD